MIKRSIFGGIGDASFVEDFKGSGEGWLLIKKKGLKVITKDWKKRYAKVSIEFPRLVLYDGPGSVGLEPKLSIVLSEGCQCVEFTDEKSKKKGFTLVSGGATVTAAAFNEEEAAKWMACIQNAIPTLQPSSRLEVSPIKKGEQQAHPTAWEEDKMHPDNNTITLPKQNAVKRSFRNDISTQKIVDDNESCFLDPMGLLQNKDLEDRHMLMKKSYEEKFFNAKSYLQNVYQHANLKELVEGAIKLKKNQERLRDEIASLVHKNFVSMIEINAIGDEMVRANDLLKGSILSIGSYENENTTLGNNELAHFANDSVKYNNFSII